jgi:hypothetical protein
VPTFFPFFRYAWSASAPEISNLLAGNQCTNHTPAVATLKPPSQNSKFPAEDCENHRFSFNSATTSGPETYLSPSFDNDEGVTVDLEVFKG